MEACEDAAAVREEAQLAFPQRMTRGAGRARLSRHRLLAGWILSERAVIRRAEGPTAMDATRSLKAYGLFLFFFLCGATNA